MKHATSITTVTAARGFTLIELMVTIALAGILTAMAVPAFNNFVLNDRAIGEINSLVASFDYARSEAVKLNNGGVQVCTSTDGQNCNGGTAWNGGWIVVESVGNPAVRTVVQYVPAFAGVNSIKATGNSPNEVTFYSTGSVDNALAITVCDNRGATFARDVEINTIGRVASSTAPGYSASNAHLACP